MKKELFCLIIALLLIGCSSAPKQPVKKWHAQFHGELTGEAIIETKRNIGLGYGHQESYRIRINNIKTADGHTGFFEGVLMGEALSGTIEAMEGTASLRGQIKGSLEKGGTYIIMPSTGNQVYRGEWKPLK